MDLAIKKARKTGAGWVVSRNSNHFGIAAYYCKMAMLNNMIGIALTNSSPLMAPTRSKIAGLGTNPISVAAPITGDDGFILDVATSAVAMGKIEIAKRVGKPIPKGWAMDAEGNITTDPIKAAEVSKCIGYNHLGHNFLFCHRSLTLLFFIGLEHVFEIIQSRSLHPSNL